MKLIATLGTTKAKFIHKCEINNNSSYKEKFSFLALKKHFNIKDEDVIIIGTKETKEKQKEYIKNFNFIEVNTDDFDDVFAKAYKTPLKGLKNETFDIAYRRKSYCKLRFN